MNCRQFRNRHVSFVDDLLSATDMRAMRDHVLLCDDCADIDVRIRRSLMVIRSMPEIEPSADFSARLNRRLSAVELVTTGPVGTRHRPTRMLATLAAGIVAVAAVTYGIKSHGHPMDATPVARGFVTLKRPPGSIADPAVMAAAPAGIPMWSAMLAAGQLPMRFASADVLEPVGER